ADGCGRVPIAAVEEKLARYREQIGAEPLSEARATELAGHPAIRQDIGLDRYFDAGWRLFSSDQLLHLYCQWTPDADREVVERRRTAAGGAHDPAGRAPRHPAGHRSRPLLLCRLVAVQLRPAAAPVLPVDAGR